MKFFLRSAALALIASIFFTGCPEPGTNTDVPAFTDNAELVGSVWVGQTPAANNTGWLTITFRAKSTSGTAGTIEADHGNYVAVLSYAHDNTSAVWDYSYDSKDRQGTGFFNGHSAWSGDATSWNPGAYTISADGKTLTFSNFMGSSRDFKKVRDTDLTIINPLPFTTGTLADNLVGSVWAGSTPAASNTGWLTITFREKATSGTAGIIEENHGAYVAVLSYAQDNTTAVWNYSYNSAARTGTAFTDGLEGGTGGTQTWNPGAYTINEDGNTITFSSFMGSERSFKRYR